MHKNNLGININSFEEMKELFFKYLPKYEDGCGPRNLEYTINFFQGYLFEFPVFFNAKNDIRNINHFKSIINDPNYDEYQKRSLFSCLCYQNDFSNILFFFNSLDKKNKEYCTSSFLTNYFEYGLRKRSLLEFINNQNLINIFKEVLELDSLNNFNYIRRLSKFLIPVSEQHPDSLLSQEVKDWKIDDFIKNIPLNEKEKYQKTMGWHLISHYPVGNSDKQKKDVFFQILKHIEKNYNDYAYYYPYSIFAYNLIIEIDPLLSNIIKEPLSKLNPLSHIENIEKTKDYTFKILKSDIHNKLNKDKLLSIIEKEIILNNFKPLTPDNIINKKRI